MKNGSIDRDVALKKIKASLGDHTILRISFKGIGDEGITALAAVLSQSQINSLYLGYNNIGHEGLTALTAVLPTSQVSLLYLDRNHISNEGITALASVLPESQIDILSLSDNEISDVGIAVLAAVLPSSQIRSLFLGNNHIRDEGLTALAAVLPSSQIRSLFLGNNHISDEGITALAAVLPSSQISNLYLSNNKIGDKGIKALFKACCECAEQGRLLKIQGVFFTQEQQDEIQQQYDATVKLTYTLKVLSVSKGLSDRLAADSELIQIPEELFARIAVQLPLCSKSVPIQRVIEERAANIEHIENIQQHLLSQKNVKIFGELLTAGIVLVGAGFVGWALQTGFMTAPGFISSKITAQISAIAWTPVTAALACAGIATIVGLALVMLMRAVGCRTHGEDMNPQRPQGLLQTERANKLQPPGEEIYQVNPNQGQSSDLTDGPNLGRASESRR